MNILSPHTFHIPVMGLAFTVDSPVKVARFGITSVVSIIEDNLLEKMRQHYCQKENEEYISIGADELDYRARRITEYLNLIDRIVSKQLSNLKAEPFTQGSEIEKYFELLPSNSQTRRLYNRMKNLSDNETKNSIQNSLRNQIVAGSIDVNIMTKIDKTNYQKNGTPLDATFSDAMSALRGFANSCLNSSVVFSAGMNPRLYSYCESFPDFFPDRNGILKKKIILKVSDYRSAMIQGKFLAKKGLWVSEFRIESGLNCGGHTFATDGYLLAPILEEFKLKREELTAELLMICNSSLTAKSLNEFQQPPKPRISVQGGIGTANENSFLLEYYNIDSTGWGSPFLLVPEATNVDDETLEQIAAAKKEDYYLSNASPLGVLFNNFRDSSADKERKQRISIGKPGSPCYNKYLAFNTEFTDKPICTASRKYQHLKITQLKAAGLSQDELNQQIFNVTEKECICSGLGSAAYLKNKIPPPHHAKTVSICPGPNLAYFNETFSLKDMVDHIYGRINIMHDTKRPNMFINELQLYVDFLRSEASACLESISAKQQKYLQLFKSNLITGIEYYKSLTSKMILETTLQRNSFIKDLEKLEQHLIDMYIPEPSALN